MNGDVWQTHNDKKHRKIWSKQILTQLSACLGSSRLETVEDFEAHKTNSFFPNMFIDQMASVVIK